MADGYIASWESKYLYNFWRPVTAIQTADTDGNPDTLADPTWTPLQLTYPIPDHDSGHSVQGGAAAESLKQFFGTDDIAFTACSLTLPAGERCTGASPVFRTYRAFRRRRTKTDCHEFWSAFTSGMLSRKAFNTAGRSRSGAANLLLKPVD